ncbi:hypothetical protein VCSRO18_3429 [Vibrio cholerae]|nr:hypothetical protein VCSRO18_3429 [Vibrio cholerae]
MRCQPLRRALNCSQGWWIIKIDIYDVFIGKSAFGNPCGVLELNGWLSDSELHHWMVKLIFVVTGV